MIFLIPQDRSIPGDTYIPAPTEMDLKRSVFNSHQSKCYHCPKRSLIMENLRKFVAVHDQLILELQADHANGCGWEVESNDGIECYSWFDDEEQPRKPGSEGKIQKFAFASDETGTFKILFKNNLDASDTFELELVVHPECEMDYANTAEGFEECLILEDESSQEWKVEDDDGVECRIGTKDGRPALFMACDTKGEYRILLSSKEKWRLIKLSVRPVNIRVRLETAPGKKVIYDVKANATTGFMWKVVDDGGLRCNDRYKPDPNPGFMCGKGGRHIFEIIADKPGTYIVRATYSRPWEKGFISSLEITVDVKNP